MAAYYFKQIDENGYVENILSYHNFRPNINNAFTEEITLEEYESLYAEMKQISKLTESLYTGTITIEDIPAAWRERVRNDVNHMINLRGNYDANEISASEFQSMIEEVL